MKASVSLFEKGLTCAEHTLCCVGCLPTNRRKRLCSEQILGTPNRKVPAGLQRTRHLVENPENFLGMFKNLIRDNQIDRTVGKWQKIMLDICDAPLIAFSWEEFCISPPSFD